MFTIVLVEPESDGNIGFVARVMKNFGIKDLVLVNPKAPLTDDVKAYSMHGYDVYEQSRRVRSLECLRKFDVVVGF
ncbi:MAG: RNA methyltransferase, partial [Candidatus Aenigmarchaeota archaeon]|nr:RNA methyltransferase [Candidatus Aenigmarchaeota archaeon]